MKNRKGHENRKGYEKQENKKTLENVLDICEIVTHPAI